MKTQLFIASKVKVGFNLRNDTYSGKLGYVIGYDGKKWRKEPSWEGWRLHFKDGPEMEQKKLVSFNEDVKRQTGYYNSYIEALDKNPASYPTDHYYREYVKNGLEGYLKDRGLGDYTKYEPNLGKLSSNKEIIPLEFDNVPTEGFVLNKKVGGYSNGWDHRSTYCRVYDPRGFEFEITVPNLLFILQECNAMKGKGLEGEFVYAWDGKDLVLLPTSSEDYKASKVYTKAQQGKVSAKELVVGLTYKHKTMVDYVYLGRFNYFQNHHDYYNDVDVVTCKKSHVFYNITEPSQNEFLALNAFAPLIAKVTDTPIHNFAEIFDKFTNSKHSDNFKLAKLEPYVIKTNFNSYYFKGNAEDCLIDLGDNKFEVYTVSVETQETGGYYNRQRIAKNYSLEGKYIVTINDNGDFSTKPLKTEYNKLSREKFSDLEPKTLKLTVNNKNKTVIF